MHRHFQQVSLLSKQVKKFDFIMFILHKHDKTFVKLKSNKIVTFPKSYWNKDCVLTEHQLFLYYMYMSMITPTECRL